MMVIGLGGGLVMAMVGSECHDMMILCLVQFAMARMTTVMVLTRSVRLRMRGVPMMRTIYNAIVMYRVTGVENCVDLKGTLLLTS